MWVYWMAVVVGGIAVMDALKVEMLVQRVQRVLDECGLS